MNEKMGEAMELTIEQELQIECFRRNIQGADPELMEATLIEAMVLQFRHQNLITYLVRKILNADPVQSDRSDRSNQTN